MGFKAINDVGPGGSSSAGETQEARESRIVHLYEQSLLLVAQGLDAESLVGHTLQQALSNGSGECCLDVVSADTW